MRTQGRVWIEVEGARRPVEGSVLWPGGVYTVSWDTSGGGREDIVFEHHPGRHERLLPVDLRLSPGGPVSVEGGFFVGVAAQLREIMDDIWRGRLCPDVFYPETFAPCFSGLDGRGPSLVLTVGWFGAEPDDPRYEAHVGRYVSERRSVRVLLDSNDRRFEALNRQVLRHEMAHFALHSAFPFAHHLETVPGAAGQPRFRFWDWLAGRFEDLSWSDRTSLVGSARVQRLSRLLRQLAEGSTASRGARTRSACWALRCSIGWKPRSGAIGWPRHTAS